MKKLLIAGNRPEIGKLFELLLWQPNLKFVSAKKLSHCLDLSLKTNPDLIIVEGSVESLEEVHEVIVALKGSTKTSRTPVILTVHEEFADDAGKAFDTLIDGLITEPFKPKEIKKLVEKYL